MPVYLIRHAHAGSRADWEGDDRERPLSKKGRAQARALTEHIDPASVVRVVSSPAARCVETVANLAREAGTSVETRRELAEGADPDQAIELILAVARENTVVSAHGDLIPKVLQRFSVLGMKTRHDPISPKGSLWVIEFNGGSPVEATYHPPG